MRHATHPAVKRSLALYRWLLRAYPPSFRERYGDEMARVFRDLARDAWHARGWSGLAEFWIRAILDLLANAMRERVRAAARLRPADILLWEFPEWIVAPVKVIGILAFMLLGWLLVFAVWAGAQLDAGRSAYSVWVAVAVALIVGLAYRFGAFRLSPRTRRMSGRCLLLACALLIIAKWWTEAYTLVMTAGLYQTLRDAEEHPVCACVFVLGLYVLFVNVIGLGSILVPTSLARIRQLATEPGLFVYGGAFVVALVAGWMPGLVAHRRHKQ